MYRKFTAQSRFENLRKEAKHWLKSLRAGDSAAKERLRRAWPEAPAQPGLRDIQHALAREYGLASWAMLKEKLEEMAFAQKNREEQVAEFLEDACLHYGVRPGTSTWDQSYFDEPSRWAHAARLLAKYPEIAEHSIHTAAVSGNLSGVKRILSERPAAATQKGGPMGWEPLLYVCYGRLAIPAVREHSAAIARLLLDAGANVKAPMYDGAHDFWPLTGAIGAGEFSQPTHPQAVELAGLLIERGANPYDPQTLYNTSLEGDDLFWLDFLYERSARLQQTDLWTAPAPPSTWPDAGMLTYLLGNAVTRNAITRARWQLERGADPSGRHFYTKRKLHTEAVLLGFTEMANLLLSFGAVAEPLNGHNAFQVACLRLDRDGAATMAREHPEYLLNATPLIQAAGRDLLEVATLLLDLGMSPDVSDPTNFRPLHAAASGDAVRVGALLIERGAEIDPRETRFNGPPLGWALYGKQQRMIAMLGALSRSTRQLVRMGNLTRLRELFASDPEMAKEITESDSLFFYLPDNEDLAIEIAELLLANGADPSIKNKEGLTAIEYAEKQGLTSVADLLSSHAHSGSRVPPLGNDGVQP